MNVPSDRRYTDAHEWIQASEDGSTVRVGITDFAQDALGDIVYADLPDTGTNVSKGETLAEIESTKSVGEVYSPVTGKVTAVNEALEDQPELVNSDPYGSGWILELALSDLGELEGLLDATAYRALIEAE